MNDFYMQDRKRFIEDMNKKWERKYRNYRKWLAETEEPYGRLG